MYQITCSIVVTEDLMYYMYSQWKSQQPVRFQQIVHHLQHLSMPSQVILRCVDRTVICQGNHEEKFVSLCTKRGGTINEERGKGDTAAFIDNQLVNDSGGQSHPCTAKKVDCDILCHDPRYNLRCKSCQFLRCTLTSSVIRVTSVDECTSSTSHTSQRNLSSAEKDTWLKNLQHSLWIAKQQVYRLKAKTGKHIENEEFHCKMTMAPTCLTSLLSVVHPLTN